MKYMGKIVKVKDMKLGWAYRPVDKTFEQAYIERMLEIRKGRNETEEEAIKQIKDHMNETGWELVPNAGLLLRKPISPQRSWEPTFILHFMKKLPEFVICPTKGPGVGRRPTGRTQWMECGSSGWYVEFYLGPEDEIEEAYPFPIAIVSKGKAPIYLPDPDKWTTVKKDTPYDPKGIDRVSVWDESDFQILAVLTVISLVLLLAGPGGWSLIVMMWIFAAFGFRSKHNKRRDYILRERKEMGVRGGGLDDHIL